MSNEPKERLDIATLSAAFAEWDRRYREEPETFMTEVEHLLGNTPESYGEACATYLLILLGDASP